MDRAEFDKFAREYRSLHQQNIRASGETPEFFAAYKVEDMARDLAGTEAKRILDFGAGVGNSTPHFRRLFPEAQLVSLDVSPLSLEVARERYPGASSLTLFDGGRIPLRDESFDAAFAACVFHHIPHEEHERLFREVRRVLRRGGGFFVFEHNPLNPLTVRAVNTCPFDENALLIGGGAMKRRLESAGFSHVVLRYRIFFPGPLAALRPLERAMTGIPFGAQYYARAIK